MNKVRLIPRLAVTGIRKNGIVYAPYLLTTAFAVAVFFVFGCIIDNPVMEHVPHAKYAVMLLETGKVLLGIILVPFLFYTNSFLIRRRKKELGLYTILGLEKKHVAVMMFLETVMTYLFSLAAGVVAAVVFGRLMFAFLLRACQLPVQTEFMMSRGSFWATAAFFAIVSAMNLAANLWQVTRVKPVELLREGRKGEKVPKHLGLYTVFGLLFLAAGYYMTFTCKLDSFILLKFPVAILLVATATYFLFTSGSIFVLNLLKRNKAFYYRKENYVCIAGMLYRMKKNAASLVNICIFSTMVIITLICTISLWAGEDEAIRFNNPYDCRYSFDRADREVIALFETKMGELAEQDQVRITETVDYIYGSLQEVLDGNAFERYDRQAEQVETEYVRMLSLNDYNRMQGEKESLEEGEILLYSNGKDFGHTDILFEGVPFHVKRELSNLAIDRKEEEAMADRMYYLVFRDEETVRALADGVMYSAIHVNFEGTEENRALFIQQADEAFLQIPTQRDHRNSIEYAGEMRVLDGGLLFIGVFFGLLFSVCVVLIMYYKQISEGFEDQDSFHIMKKVGMSDEDVRSTIRRQILLVFGLPVAAAILHTVCSMNMTVHLLYTLNLFDTAQIYRIGVGVTAVFLVFYGVSYLITARTYYKIVR